MRSFAFFLALVAIASAAIAPTSPPATECVRYQLTTNTNLMVPSTIPGYVPNVIIYDANALMTGTPEGPFFTVRPSDCFWVPTGAFSCSMDLYLEAARTTLIGFGTLNSTDLTVQGISTIPGFHMVSGHMQLTTTITATGFTAPTPDINFHPLSTSIFFPAVIMLPVGNTAASSDNVANGVSYVGSNEFLTLWGSNGNWNGTTFDNTRTTGFDLRASLVCSPPPSGGGGHSTGACPSCPAGGVTVPSACIDQSLPVSQSVPGNCISLSFAASSSSTAFNGCSGGSLS